MGFLVVLLVLSAFVWEVGAKEEAFSTVEDAEQALEESYVAVLEAEEDGANVSRLLDRLNRAGRYLTVARICLKTGKFECAVGNASLCMNQLDGVVGDAQELREKAMRKSTIRSWIMVVGSVIAEIGVIYGGWRGWKRFKRWRHNQQRSEEGVEGGP